MLNVLQHTGQSQTANDYPSHNVHSPEVKKKSNSIVGRNIKASHSYLFVHSLCSKESILAFVPSSVSQAAASAVGLASRVFIGGQFWESKRSKSGSIQW